MEDIEDLLVAMEQELNEGHRRMFGGVTINPDMMYSLINRIRESLPVVLQEARYLVKNRDQYISEETERAQSILAAAQARADQLVNENNITQAATAKANALVQKAQEESMDIARAMNEDIQRELAAAERALAGALERVRRAQTGRGTPPPNTDLN